MYIANFVFFSISKILKIGEFIENGGQKIEIEEVDGIMAECSPENVYSKILQALNSTN